MKRVAKQVRDGLPIVGLIARLTTPEGIGGKDIAVCESSTSWCWPSLDPLAGFRQAPNTKRTVALCDADVPRILPALPGECTRGLQQRHGPARTDGHDAGTWNLLINCAWQQLSWPRGYTSKFFQCVTDFAEEVRDDMPLDVQVRGGHP